MSACNIAIHALMMALVIRVAQATGAVRTTRPSWRLASVMIVTVLALMASHTTEVMVWALAYWLVNAVSVGADLTYFVFVELYDAGLRRRRAR